jgi:hypothetical protein
MADKKLRIPRKLKTETLKQLKIRTDMNSDAPYVYIFMKFVQKMYSLFVWYIFKTAQQ